MLQGVRDNEAQDALGAGYDALAEERKNGCVVVTALEQKPVLGQQVEFSLTKIASSDQLNKSMNISASASIKSGLRQGSAKANFAQSLTVNSYSTYILVSVKVSNALTEMRGVTLTEDAKNAYIQGPERFRQMCGDEFVSGYAMGGEYAAVLRIDSKNSDEKNALDAQIKYKAFSGKVEFQSAIEEISKTNSMEVSLFQRGGQGDKIPSNAAEVIAQAVNFPSKVSDVNAYTYQTLTEKYTTLALPPGVQVIDTAVQESVIALLAQESASTTDALSDIRFIEENSEQFEAYEASDLDKRKNEAISNLNKVNGASRVCFHNYTMCAVPALSALSGTLPTRRSASATSE